MDHTIKVFQLMSIYSILVPLFVGLIMIRRFDLNSQLMFILLIGAAFPQLGSLFMDRETKNALYNFYTLFDNIFWALIFFINSKRPGFKIIIIGSVFLFILCSVYLFALSGISNRFYTELVCISNIIQVMLVLSFYYSLYMEEEVYELERLPIFWYSLGLLLYVPSTYFLFVFWEELRHQDKYPELWIIHNLLNTLMYLVFAVGMYTNIYRPSKIMK